MEGDGEAPLVGWCRGNDVEEGRPGEGHGRRPSRAAGAYLRPIISEVPCLEQRLTALAADAPSSRVDAGGRNKR